MKTSPMLSLFGQATCYLLIFAVLLAPLSSLAQESTTQDSTFRNGRILTTEGFTLKFSRAVLDGDAVLYSSKAREAERPLELSKVLRIQRQNGTHALEFFLVGALSSALGAFIGVNSSPSSGVVSSGTKSGIVLTLTAVGGLASLVIGARQPKYKTVYTNPQNATP